MANEILTVLSFFKSIQVHLSDVWLESCINWCKSEIFDSNYTLNELKSKVYEQWLLLDLRDVEIPCLPPNLSSHKHFVLNGNFCLQMMHVIDISKPKLWQLQRIRNTSKKGGQDADTIGTGKRKLQLTLTDGVQEVEAVEYKPVVSLSINLTPGVKIRIMGPVVVRRGRFMLERQNVKILGGEVEELLVSNAAENVLARALKLPENPNPTLIEEKLLINEKEEENNTGYKRIVEHLKPQPEKNTFKSISVTKVTPMITDQDDEAKEIEHLMLQAEQNLPESGTNNNSKTPDLFEDDDFNPDDFECLDQMATTSTQVFTHKQNQPQRNKSPFKEDEDVFDEIDIDAHLDAVECKNKGNQNKLQPIITIAKLLEECNFNKTHKIRAKFKSVVEKLSVGEEEYKMVIKIEDETSDLTVKIHSDLISEFAGHTPQSIQILKSSVLCKQQSAVEEVMKALQKLKDWLVKLDGLMEVKTARDEIPVIIKIY